MNASTETRQQATTTPEKRYSMWQSKRLRGRISAVLTHSTLLFLAVFMLFPLVYLFSRSLMDPSEIYTLPPTLWPAKAQWENYAIAWSRAPFILFTFNSVKIVVLLVVGMTFSSAMCGFGFGRLSFPGRDIIFAIVLATLMLPGAVTMIPLYVIFRDLGWLNTHLPLWLPAWFGGGAFNIFLFRQFFRTLPRELDEAAILDGASSWKIFTRIALPLSKPVVVVVATFASLNTWTDLLTPMIYIRTFEKFTLAQALYNVFRTSYYGTSQVQYVAAMSILFVIPALILFIFVQRNLTEGIVMTGFK